MVSKVVGVFHDSLDVLDIVDYLNTAKDIEMVEDSGDGDNITELVFIYTLFSIISRPWKQISLVMEYQNPGNRQSGQ